MHCLDDQPNMSNESRTLYVAQKGEAVPWEVPVQKLRHGEVQVKVKAVSINPVDAEHVASRASEGCGVGCDFAGVVSNIGEGVTSVKVGDTVAGGVGGSNVDAKMDGAFSDTIRVKAEGLFTFPQPLASDKSNSIPAGPIKSFEQAASLGVGLGTAVMSLAWYDHLPIKKDSCHGYAVVYGDLSALQYMIIQVTQFLGFKVIAVSSKNGEKLLKDAGASDIVGYNDADWKDQVRAIGGNQISLVYDCTSSSETVVDAYSLITSQEQSYVNFFHPFNRPELRAESLKDNVRLAAPSYFTLHQDVKKFGTSHSITAEPGLIEAREDIFASINSLLENQAIVAPPITVIGNGISSIPDLFKELEKDSDGTKLVIRL